MAIGRQLGKGHHNELGLIEAALERSPVTALRRLRSELEAGATVMTALAETVLADPIRTGVIRPELVAVIGANWFGPDHHWVEPCTTVEQIHSRMRDTIVEMVDRAVVDDEAPWRIELWCQCGHPNFQSHITWRETPGWDRRGLVIVTLLTPDNVDRTARYGTVSSPAVGPGRAAAVTVGALESPLYGERAGAANPSTAASA